MAKILIKTQSSCCICEDKLSPETHVIMHKTRRQTHALCFSCFILYTAEPINVITANLRRNIRSKMQFIKCPGTYCGKIRNRCKKDIDIRTIKIPEVLLAAEQKLSTDLFRINLLLNSPNSYLCPAKECGNIIEIDPTYESLIISCIFCKQEWCRQCLVVPFHKNKTCLEAEIEDKKSDNAKLIWELSKQGKIKFCPKCKSPIFRSGGCNKMRCELCRSSWCWICLEIDIEYSHFNILSGKACGNRLWEGAEIV